MTYVIADIHSEITKLKNLIYHIIKHNTNPKLVFIGDYIDKGEDALSTLNYLVELDKKYECVFLRGNHEYCWFNTPNEDYILKYGGTLTITSLKCTNFIDAQKKLITNFKCLFDKLVNYHLIDNFLITHSGLPEEYLINSNLDNLNTNDFLFNRYDFIKSEKLFSNTHKVIFGHTGFYKPYVDDFKIGIDTSACYLVTQPLTSFCIENSYFLNSFGKTDELNDFNSNCCPNIVRVKPWRTYV
jgi:serine/threonine protein phosphatase 1